MSTQLGIIILAEVALSLFIIWGFLHEDIFIRFEDRVCRAVSRRFSRKRRAARRLRVVGGRSARKGPDRSAA